MQCGLLGRKLGHSYSPAIHSMLADYSYQLFEVEPDALEGFLKKAEFSGLNVTIPYKKAVIPFCDELSDTAKRLGAVNTIVRRNGKLIGHNTDYFGFMSMVQRTGICTKGKKALVLGSGGASATAVCVLQEMGAETIVISRSGENNYDNLEKHKDAAIIVNATPVGMFPNTEQTPLSLDIFPDLECVLDLIYNPANTMLLQQAQKRNICNQNGLWMLVAQAKESAQWFSGHLIEDTIMKNVYHAVRNSMESVMLIGMPGCGKSTIGKILAEKSGKTFFDADAVIVDRAGISIPEIFANSGEEGFRKLETEVLSELGKKSGAIISTGGGCITRIENYRHLHLNSKIIWIKRKIEDLPTDGRPLSQVNKLCDLYAQRKPLYESFCDAAVCNDGAPEDTAEQILYLLKGEAQ